KVFKSMERHYIHTSLKISQRWFTTIFCLITLLQTGITTAAESILVVSIPENSAHQKFSKVFRNKLALLNPEIDIVDLSIDDYEPSSERLVVTLGSRAFIEITEQSGPMFHALISRSLYEEYYSDDAPDKYYLAFEQPLERMLQLHSLALPKSRDVGVLLGDTSSLDIKKLRKQANSFGKNIFTEKIEDNFAENLSKLLKKVDSLLLFPDPEVINRSTINSLVLDSYHKKTPLVGYSSSLVKAGAMLAIYSTPAQLAEDSAQLVSRILYGKNVPVSNYPKQFKISVNYRLSRIYGISIPSEKSLLDKITEGKSK
ncbi:hypothetical protein KA005_36845, partial [bacterium]|nr:hypothetical protein [bacterium]